MGQLTYKPVFAGRQGDYNIYALLYTDQEDEITGSGALTKSFQTARLLPNGNKFIVGATTGSGTTEVTFTAGATETITKNGIVFRNAFDGDYTEVTVIAPAGSSSLSVYGSYFAIDFKASVNNYPACIVADKTQTSYDPIPSTVTLNYNGATYNNAPVRSLRNNGGYGTPSLSCFEDCRLLVTAPEIPQAVTGLMTKCFYNCPALSGNITVNNAPSIYTNVFRYTTNEIYILNGGTADANIWRTIASQSANVHYELDDNPAPTVSNFTATRVSASGQTAYNERGTWAHIQATINIFDIIPVGWTNELKSITLKKDGSVITPTWTPSSPTLFPVTMECWVNTGDIGTHTFSLQIADSVKNNGTEVKSISSAELTISLLKSYTLVDYYHDQTTGTEGIAFGKYAESADLFEVDMETKFDQGLTALDDIITTKNLKGANTLLELDTTATSGSDKEIYDALVSLGWTDCIV